MRLGARITYVTSSLLLLSLLALSYLDARPFASVAEAQSVNGQPDRADGIDASYFVRIETPDKGDGDYVENEEILFRAVVTGASNPAALTYIWDMGDGISLSGSEVTHTYTAEGAYTITVHVRLGSESAIAVKPIVVQPQILRPQCEVQTGAPTIAYDKFPTYGSTTSFDFVPEPFNASIQVDWDFGTGFDGDVGSGRSVTFDFSRAADASDGIIDKRWTLNKDNNCGVQNGRQCTFWVVATAAPTDECVSELGSATSEYGMPVFMGDQTISGLVLTPFTLGDSIFVTAAVESGTNVDFYWEYGNTKVPKQKGVYSGTPKQVKSRLPVDLAALSRHGEVEVRVRAVNSASSATASVDVKLSNNVTILNDGPKGAGSSITFSALGLPEDEELTFSWDPGYPTAEVETTSVPVFTHLFGQKGKWLVVLKAESADTTFYGGSIAYVGVSAPGNSITIDLKDGKTVPVLGEELRFCVTAPDKEESYTWDFGDGSPTETDPTEEGTGRGCVKHTYQEVDGRRSFILNLKVQDNAGNLVGETDLPLIMEDSGEVSGQGEIELPVRIMLPMVNKGFINLAARFASGQEDPPNNQPVAPVPQTTPTPETVAEPEATPESPRPTPSSPPTAEPGDDDGDHNGDGDGDDEAGDDQKGTASEPTPEPTTEPLVSGVTSGDEPEPSTPPGTIPPGTVSQPPGTIPPTAPGTIPQP